MSLDMTPYGSIDSSSASRMTAGRVPHFSMAVTSVFASAVEIGRFDLACDGLDDLV